MSIALIRLTRPNGSLVWLNPTAVAALTEETEKPDPPRPGQTKKRDALRRVTRIHLQSGTTFDVLELHDDPAWNSSVKWSVT